MSNVLAHSLKFLYYNLLLILQYIKLYTVKYTVYTVYTRSEIQTVSYLIYNKQQTTV